MKKEDVLKGMEEKVVKSINFDKIVLTKLEEKARLENTTVSFIVNRFIRNTVLNNGSYYRELAKHHYLKFQEFNYMKDQCEIIKEGKE